MHGRSTGFLCATTHKPNIKKSGIAMQGERNNLQFNNGPGVTGETIQEALQALNKYLAMINGRLEILLLSDLPEYVMVDLHKVYHAEQEASQIVRGLNIFCHKSF
jgi:hypothetical protein